MGFSIWTANKEHFDANANVMQNSAKIKKEFKKRSNAYTIDEKTVQFVACIEWQTKDQTTTSFLIHTHTHNHFTAESNKTKLRRTNTYLHGNTYTRNSTLPSCMERRSECDWVYVFEFDCVANCCCWKLNDKGCKQREWNKIAVEQYFKQIFNKLHIVNTRSRITHLLRALNKRQKEKEKQNFKSYAQYYS